MLPSTTHKSRNKRDQEAVKPDLLAKAASHPISEGLAAIQEHDPTPLVEELQTSPKTPASGKARLRSKYEATRSALGEAVRLVEQTVNNRPETLPLYETSVGQMLDELMRCSLAVEAMQLATSLLEENDPDLAQQTLAAMQKLRGRTGRWKRNSTGWFELRYVNGAGPYLYHRYRGEDGRKYTDYYGRVQPLTEEHKQAQK
jgi:hypothetical protein